MTIAQLLSSPAALAAFASTALISLVPNFILIMMPQYEGGGSTSIWLSLGQSMAAGGLLGDVFLHTLAERSSEATGIWVLVGFTFFLASDLLIRSLHAEQKGGGAHHSHNHSHQNTTTEIRENGAVKSETPSIREQHNHLNRSAIILSIAGDSLHNFTDGLAIGASYSMQQDSSVQVATLWHLLRNHSRGGLATLSILFHEVPHELGDFCTLVRAGYSKREALVAQFYTAVAAFCGTATAIVVSEEAWAEERLLWITAGGFLYLAGTTILPEVLSEEGVGESSTCTSKRRWFRFAQLLAFCLGISFLYMVALLEEAEDSSSDPFHGHHHHRHHHAHDQHGHGEEL